MVNELICDSMDTYLPADGTGTYRTTGLNFWETINAINNGNTVPLEKAVDAARVLNLSNAQQSESYLVLTVEQRETLKQWLEKNI